MKKLLLLVFVFCTGTSICYAQAGNQPLSTGHFDSTTRVLIDSLSMGNAALKIELSRIVTRYNDSLAKKADTIARQRQQQLIDSLSGGNTTLKKELLEALNKSIKNVLDTLPKISAAINKATAAAAVKTEKEKNDQKDKIGSYPTYCKGQKYFIVKKLADGNYEIWVNDVDTLPKDNKRKAIAVAGVAAFDSLPAKFYTARSIDFGSFSEWAKAELKSCDDKASSLVQSKLQDIINNYENGSIMAAHRKEVDSLSQLLVDYDRVAGEIRLNKRVKVYAIIEVNGRDKRAEVHQFRKGGIETMQQDKMRKKKYIIDWGTPIGELEIIKARVQIDNNRIFDFSFDANFYDNNNVLVRRLNTITNNYYSFSFKALNNREYKYIASGNASSYPEPVLKGGFGFNYGDLINYSPRNGDFTPIVKNANYELSRDTAVVVYRRRYSDYLSFRTFLDPLGFLDNNPNGFAQLEGDAYIPCNLRNIRRHSWFDHLRGNLTYIYNNSVNSTPRVARSLALANDSFSIYNPLTSSYIRKTDTSSYINNLDLVKYAYYQFYLRMTLYTVEIKRENSWLHLELGARALGAKVGTQKDTTTYPKLIPEFNLQWVLRPDNIFGADVNVGLSYLGNTHLANNDPHTVSNKSFLWKNAWGLPHELNIYVLTGKESKGGLFFRYSGWLSFNRKLATSIDEKLLPGNTGIGREKSAYFPQILVGYSSNLSTMIKRAGQEK